MVVEVEVERAFVEETVAKVLIEGRAEIPLRAVDIDGGGGSVQAGPGKADKGIDQAGVDKLESAVLFAYRHPGRESAETKQNNHN